MNEIALFVEYIGALLRIYAGWRVREMSDIMYRTLSGKRINNTV